MNNKHLMIISILSCCAGIIFYSIQKKWIIFQFPLYSMTHLQSAQQASKKNITLHWYTQNTWHKDTICVLWEHPQKNCMLVVNAWLDNAVQEEIIPHDVHVESIAITSSNEAIISFDSTLFAPQTSIAHKLYCIQGMLRSIKEALPHIQTVRFLLHQELYLDPHLDFWVSWSCN